MLQWLDARHGSSLTSFTWNGNTLSFTITVAAGANGLQAMLPTTSAFGCLTGLTSGRAPVSYSTQTIKGVQYAVFSATSGTYQASYSGIPTSVAVNPMAVTLNESQAVQFKATINVTTNPSVFWTLSPAVRAISTGGLYVAPTVISSAQAVTINATSAGHPTKSSSAIVRLVSVTSQPTTTVADTMLSRFSAGTGNKATSPK
jgi:hypothetical protein